VDLLDNQAGKMPAVINASLEAGAHFTATKMSAAILAALMSAGF
jgi:hypothetical protein